MSIARFALVLLAFTLSGTAFAQDLTGIWRGHFSRKNGIYQMLNMDERYKFEVQIDQRSKILNGVTYSYKNTEFYGKAVVNGTVNPKTKKVLLQELQIVEVRMSMGSDACTMTCFLQYSKYEGEEILEGTYTSMNIRDSSNCGKGTVFLRKVPTSDFYKEPFLVNRENDKKKNPPVKITPKVPDSTKTNNSKAIAKTTPPAKTTTKTQGGTKTTASPSTKKPIAQNKPEPEKNLKPQTITGIDPQTEEKKMPNVKKSGPVIVPPVLKNRQNELAKTLLINTNTITVSLYDNGTIDNDTISVYLDKKLVISNQRLSLTPLTVTIHLDDDDNYHELVMVAENLGDIPPNTSLMVVKAGEKQFEVNITSTEQKNAVVIFKYDKPKGL